jgi:hypothetical protein
MSRALLAKRHSKGKQLQNLESMVHDANACRPTSNMQGRDNGIQQAALALMSAHTL